MKIAIIAFTNPFVNKSDGGKIDIYNRILALSKPNTEIDLYSVLKKDEKQINPKVQNVNIYLECVKNKVGYIFSKYPISVNNRYNKKNKEMMKNRLYDLAIFENANMIKYLDKKDIKSKINYLRVHNIESEYRKDTFKSSFPRFVSILEYIEGIKYKHIENNYLNKFDKFLFISSDEQKKYIKLYPKYKEKFVWVPPVIECRENINFNEIKGDTILFYGDMTVSHNLEGIKWFSKYIFPKIVMEKPNVVLNIVGKILDKDKKTLVNCSKNINVLGYVDDLEKVISEATLVIAPIFHGAGVKIKVLHALSEGKILIATQKAIEGTDFKNDEHLILANTKEEYVECCLKVLANYKKYLFLVENAQTHIKNKYSIQSQNEVIMAEYENDRNRNKKYDK